LAETIASFKAVIEGEGDQLPEQAFYMVGGMEAAQARGRELEAGAAA
jgi:F0F1-type ATP synthase beta subunit